MLQHSDRAGQVSRGPAGSHPVCQSGRAVDAFLLPQASWNFKEKPNTVFILLKSVFTGMLIFHWACLIGKKGEVGGFSAVGDVSGPA